MISRLTSLVRSWFCLHFCVNLNFFNAHFRGFSVEDPGFPRAECANSDGRGANLLFGNSFAENCMKSIGKSKAGEKCDYQHIVSV